MKKQTPFPARNLPGQLNSSRAHLELKSASRNVLAAKVEPAKEVGGENKEAQRKGMRNGAAVGLWRRNEDRRAGGGGQKKRRRRRVRVEGLQEAVLLPTQPEREGWQKETREKDMRSVR